MKKCFITIQYYSTSDKMQIMINTDITEMGFSETWNHIQGIVARYCTLGSRLESIHFYDEDISQ